MVHFSHVTDPKLGVAAGEDEPDANQTGRPKVFEIRVRHPEDQNQRSDQSSSVIGYWSPGPETRAGDW